MQLRLLEQVLVLGGEGQSLSNRFQTFVRLPVLAARVGENAAVERERQFGPCGPVSCEALPDLRQRVGVAALLQQSRRPVQRAGRVPEGEALLDGDGDFLVPRGLGFTPQPAVLIQPAGVVQGIRQAERMRDLPEPVPPSPGSPLAPDQGSPGATGRRRDSSGV